LVFIAFIALLFGFYAIGIVFAFIATTPDDAANAVLLFTMAAKVGIGWFAVRDRSQNGELTPVWKILIFACAFIPVVIWLAIYWAAREVVRQRTLFHMTWLGAAAAALAVYLIVYDPAFLVGANTVNAPAEDPVVFVATATVRIASSPIPSTSTKRPSPTATPRPTQRPASAGSSAPDCLPFASVSLRDVGRDLCVYGIVWQEYENEQAYFVEFSRASDALYLVSYDFVFPDLDSGDCVTAEGEIDQLGDNPVMVVRDLYHCQ